MIIVKKERDYLYIVFMIKHWDAVAAVFFAKTE